MGGAVRELAVKRDKAVILITLLCLFARPGARAVAAPSKPEPEPPPDLDMPPELPLSPGAQRGSRVPPKPPRKLRRPR